MLSGHHPDPNAGCSVAVVSQADAQRRCGLISAAIKNYKKYKISEGLRLEQKPSDIFMPLFNFSNILLQFFK